MTNIITEMAYLYCTNERMLHRWFEKNFKLFGYDRLVKSQWRKSPDLILEKKGNTYRIELEVVASNFISHGHNPKDVDIVYCLVNNCHLPVRTIEIKDIFLQKENIRKKGIFEVKLDSDMMAKMDKLIKEGKFDSRDSLLDYAIRDLLNKQTGNLLA